MKRINSAIELQHIQKKYEMAIGLCWMVEWRNKLAIYIILKHFYLFISFLQHPMLVIGDVKEDVANLHT